MRPRFALIYGTSVSKYQYYLGKLIMRPIFALIYATSVSKYQYYLGNIDNDNLGLFGPIWAYLGLSEPMWAYLSLSGPIWPRYTKIHLNALKMHITYTKIHLNM
jgi:hypothetical protein